MRIRTVGAGMALLMAAAMSAAQSYPERPITLICAYGVGASTDLAMRALAEAASKHLGQRIIVENRAGASGTIGPTYLARNARPDGYTIGQMPITVFRMPYLEIEQENWYLNSADDARYAQETFAAEKSVIERLGLRK